MNRRAALFLLGAAAWLPAFAAFPDKPLTIVVPYAAGGVSDALARALGQRLGAALKQTVVVENKPGGNTLIGASYVAKAPADGYTLLLTAEATFIANPHLYSKLPYDATTSFTPIAALVATPQSLVVNPQVEANSLSEFIAAAKRNPARFQYATLGPGSTAHLNMVLFQKTAGLQLTDVPYKGASVAVTDLLGGHVSTMMVSTGLVAQHARAGRLKVLAVSGQTRSPLIPDAPTFAEAGLANFAPSSWFALVAPARTPPEVVAQLNGAVNAVLRDPAFRSSFVEAEGLVTIGGSSQELARLIVDGTARMKTVIQDANIKLE